MGRRIGRCRWLREGIPCFLYRLVPFISTACSKVWVCTKKQLWQDNILKKDSIHSLNRCKVCTAGATTISSASTLPLTFQHPRPPIKYSFLPPRVHRYDVTGLEAGTAIYARVSAHTLMSYGYAGLSNPEFETPSNVQPGAPSSVRLLETSDSSIAVEWDHPTVDGGADVAGYELWMGEWATSSFRLVYDGVDDEDTTSFTVDARCEAMSAMRWS